MSFMQRLQEKNFTEFQYEDNEPWSRVTDRIDTKATHTSQDPLDLLIEAEEEAEESGYDLQFHINRKIEEITHG